MSLCLYQLPPSPNNRKVRIALRFKGLDHETVDVPFHGYPPKEADRADVLRVSGQPLTPVLVHDGRAIWDSAAILRYLDSAFPETPPLFSRDYGEMRAIEEWETYGRGEAGQPVGLAFRQWVSGNPDAGVLAEAQRRAEEVGRRLEERLAQGSWLAADRMTAADVTTAPVVFHCMVPAQAAAQGGAAAFLHEHLRLPEDCERTRDWVRRVMAYDRAS